MAQPPQAVFDERRFVSQPFASFPSQLPKPAAQTRRHTPASHDGAAFALVEHVLPQLPQFPGSVRRSRHTPEQFVVEMQPPAVQGGVPAAPHETHLPRSQACPVAQRVPQRPQCAVSLVVATSQPLSALPSQSANPAAQLATAHAPARQLAVVLGNEHARPHAPQFAASVASDASQPLAALRSQSP